MTRSEKLNWTIAIVGLIASLISIFAFVTGANSIGSLRNKPEPARTVSQTPPTSTAAAVPPKKDTLGDKATAPLKNGINWIGGRLKPRKMKP